MQVSSRTIFCRDGVLGAKKERNGEEAMDRLSLFVVAGGLLLLLFLVVCSPAPRLCAAGSTQSCQCVRNDRLLSGVQRCHLSGEYWEECQCVTSPPAEKRAPESTRDGGTEEEASEPSQERGGTRGSNKDGGERRKEPPEALLPDGGETRDAPEEGPEEAREKPAESTSESTPEPWNDATAPTKHFHLDLWYWGVRAALSMTIDEGGGCSLPGVDA